MNLPSKSVVALTIIKIVIIRMKRREGAVDLQCLPDLSRPLGPDVVGTKIKIREYPVDGQRLSDRPPRPGLQPPAPTPASLSWKALEYTMGAMNGVHFSTEVGSCT